MKHSIDSFLKVLGPAALQSVRDINPSHIERFRNHRLDEGVAPKTVGLDVKILSIGLRRAEKPQTQSQNQAARSYSAAIAV